MQEWSNQSYNSGQSSKDRILIWNNCLSYAINVSVSANFTNHDMTNWEINEPNGVIVNIGDALRQSKTRK